ncbi:hypothetical protein BGZ76_011122 [Entomortierella beljakovae]|nr:hypothetical protein BGZ76_011122 [Entomortierella beljakovae]
MENDEIKQTVIRNYGSFAQGVFGKFMQQYFSTDDITPEDIDTLRSLNQLKLSESELYQELIRTFRSIEYRTELCC